MRQEMPNGDALRVGSREGRNVRLESLVDSYVSESNQTEHGGRGKQLGQRRQIERCVLGDRWSVDLESHSTTGGDRATVAWSLYPRDRSRAGTADVSVENTRQGFL